MFGSISTNTGRAPVCTIASAVAMNVIGAVITSSPAPIPNAISDSRKRVGTAAHADHVARAQKGGEFGFERRHLRTANIRGTLVDFGELPLHAVMNFRDSVPPDPQI